MNSSELYALAQRHFGDLGPEVVAQMAAIAMAESRANPLAHNTSGEDSRGLFQINIGPGANTDLAGMNLFDPEQNARAARIVYDRQGPRAWSVYSGGQYQQFLPQFGSGAQNMTMDYSPIETAGGSGIIDQILNYLNITGSQANQFANTSGYYDPSRLSEMVMPTLAREMFDQEKRDADRQYQLDLGRFGLEQATLNYQQRLSAAQTRIQELGLLASQRGPGDAFAYQYALRGLSAPEGQQVSPFTMSASINQPSNIQIPNQTVPAAPAAATVPSTQPIANAAPSMPTWTQDQDSGRWTSSAPAGVSDQAWAGMQAASNPVIPENPVIPKDSFVSNQGVTWTQDASGKWSSSSPFNKAARGGAMGEWNEMKRYVNGGNADGRMLMLGDSASGQPTGNEEIVVNPTNAPLGIVPNEAIPEGAVDAANPAGTPSAEEILQIIAGLLSTIDLEGGPEGDPGMQRAAAGGMFGTTVYSPEVMAGAPAISAVSGGPALSGFQGAALDMKLPGTSTQIQQGHRASLPNFQRMLGSEQEMVRGAVETPREMGGLGLNWGDWLQSMVRAAPTGQSFGATAYR